MKKYLTKRQLKELESRGIVLPDTLFGHIDFLIESSSGLAICKYTMNDKIASTCVRLFKFNVADNKYNLINKEIYTDEGFNFNKVNTTVFNRDKHIFYLTYAIETGNTLFFKLSIEEDFKRTELARPDINRCLNNVLLFEAGVVKIKKCCGTTISYNDKYNKWKRSF